MLLDFFLPALKKNRRMQCHSRLSRFCVYSRPSHAYLRTICSSLCFPLFKPAAECCCSVPAEPTVAPTARCLLRRPERGHLYHAALTYRWAPALPEAAAHWVPCHRAARCSTPALHLHASHLSHWRAGLRDIQRCRGAWEAFCTACSGRCWYRPSPRVAATRAAGAAGVRSQGWGWGCTGREIPREGRPCVYRGC